jgi:hypothetical protein
MLVGSDGGDTAIVLRTFGSIETSSSRVVISMPSIIGIVVGEGPCEWGDSFFRSRAFSPSTPRCVPPALVIVEWLLCCKSVLGGHGVRCDGRVASKMEISRPALF